MELIRQIESELDELKSEISLLQSRRKTPVGQIDELEEKVKTRQELIKAVIKNVETNHDYVSKQEERFLSTQIVQPKK